jgi:hypothetical protein
VADLTGTSDASLKGLTPATIGFDANMVAHTHTYTATTLMGYGLGTWTLSREATEALYPYVSYSLNSVNSHPVKSGNFDNLSVGMLSDTVFPFLGMESEVLIYPQFTRSLYDHASSLTIGAAYEPEPVLPFINAPYAVDKLVYVSLVPAGNVVYTHVIDAGTDPLLATTSNFLRAGPGLSAHLYGYEDGPLKQFSFGANYTYFGSMDGTTPTFSDFQAAISFSPLAGSAAGGGGASSASQNFTITLKYVAGRDLSSLKKQQDLTLGVGLKF